MLALKQLLEQEQVAVPISGSDVVDLILNLSEGSDTEEIVQGRERLLRTLPPLFQAQWRAKEERAREEQRLQVEQPAQAEQQAQESPKTPLQKPLDIALLTIMLCLFGYYVVMQM
ncbi:hypothetical protein C2W62_30295 [Candidatus Entotheonella serta]|nr:hypothetical protein C2W62_30295 [Candidatus Entotheonella serta]